LVSQRANAQGSLFEVKGLNVFSFVMCGMVALFGHVGGRKKSR